MTCVDTVCGTGTWTGPKPGDPDNNIALSANTVYGGIDVSWTYPATNPAAVAHTLLYRGTTSTFAQAAQRAVVAGSVYYDKSDVAVDTNFYYWVKIVSVNGTTMDPVGPVMATMKPRSAQTLESLTGLIDNGVLATSLKTSIGNINNVNAALLQEIQDRLNANSAFAQAMSDVQNGVTQAMTLISTETTQRKDGDNALASSVSIIAAANQNALAAIDEEKQTRVTNDTAYAQKFTSLFTTVGDSQTGLVHDLSTLTTAYNSTASSVTTLVSKVGDAQSGLVHDLNVTTTTANSASTTANSANTLAGSANTLAGTANSTANSAYSLAGAAYNYTTSVASDVTTLQTTVNGNTASGQIGLTTKVTTLDGKVTSIGALYTAKVQVNGLIGGFGVYNDGSSVEAGFDVDRFWVGRSDVSGGKVKPFIVDSGIVYIDKARIRNADIDTLKLAGTAVTANSASTGGSNTIPSGGSATILYGSTYLPDNSNSGVVLSCTVALYCANDASCVMRIWKGATAIGDTGISLRGGYHNTFCMTAFDPSPNVGNTTYSFVISNNSSGSGSNQTVTVESSSFVVSGAKR